jgi:hypothetical protein
MAGIKAALGGAKQVARVLHKGGPGNERAAVQAAAPLMGKFERARN